MHSLPHLEIPDPSKDAEKRLGCTNITKLNSNRSFKKLRRFGSLQKKERGRNREDNLDA